MVEKIFQVIHCQYPFMDTSRFLLKDYVIYKYDKYVVHVTTHNSRMQLSVLHIDITYHFGGSANRLFSMLCC